MMVMMLQAVGTGVGAAEGIASKGTKAPAAPSPFLFFGVIEPFCEAILCNVGFKALVWYTSNPPLRQ